MNDFRAAHLPPHGRDQQEGPDHGAHAGDLLQRTEPGWERTSGRQELNEMAILAEESLEQSGLYRHTAVGWRRWGDEKYPARGRPRFLMPHGMQLTDSFHGCCSTVIFRAGWFAQSLPR